MALMDIFAHANILRPKGRGINPKEIKTTFIAAASLLVVSCATTPPDRANPGYSANDNDEAQAFQAFVTDLNAADLIKEAVIGQAQLDGLCLAYYDAFPNMRDTKHLQLTLRGEDWNCRKYEELKFDWQSCQNKDYSADGEQDFYGELYCEELSRQHSRIKFSPR
ncbi:MAG: hypothetical protein H6861_01400 [Rhodospirillales bacterium]|nr:hypothetical protein [Rhodospirillales bacterium]